MRSATRSCVRPSARRTVNMPCSCSSTVPRSSGPSRSVIRPSSIADPLCMHPDACHHCTDHDRCTGIHSDDTNFHSPMIADGRLAPSPCEHCAICGRRQVSYGCFKPCFSSASSSNGKGRPPHKLPDRPAGGRAGRGFGGRRLRLLRRTGKHVAVGHSIYACCRAAGSELQVERCAQEVVQALVEIRRTDPQLEVVRRPCEPCPSGACDGPAHVHARNGHGDCLPDACLRDRSVSAGIR